MIPGPRVLHPVESSDDDNTLRYRYSRWPDLDVALLTEQVSHSNLSVIINTVKSIGNVSLY